MMQAGKKIFMRFSAKPVDLSFRLSYASVMKRLNMSVVRSSFLSARKRFMSAAMSILSVIARRRRSTLRNVTFIGITGSAGKTMAKELVANILSRFGSCAKTAQSFNTIVAVVSLMLRHVNKRHRYCVAEIAATGPKTMERSVNVFKPDVAVLTVIGKDHYGAYGNMDLLAAEKEKLILSLMPHGTAVLNIDDPRVKAIGERCNRRVIWIGGGEGAELRLMDASSCWPEPLSLTIAHQGVSWKIQTHFHGTHLATSVLASLGVALALELPLETAIKEACRMQPLEGRMQPVADKYGVVFIRDDMKAPHWSLAASITFLSDAKAVRKIAVLGTISDMSGDSAQKYKQVCRQFREVADVVVLVGPNAHRGLRARKSHDDASIQGFSHIQQAAEYLEGKLQRGDLVLIRASRKADHLERLVINRNKPIRCWNDDCRKARFCSTCPQLYKG